MQFTTVLATLSALTATTAAASLPASVVPASYSSADNVTLAYPDCIDLVFALPINSSGIVDPTAPFLIPFAINETYNLNARYCVPTVAVNGKADILQLLVHGITYNRNYWSGLDNPGFHGTNYSWIAYAANLGYPTLSLDRLGHGLSDHPDPISINQNQPQIDLMHALVKQIKSGAVLPKSFQKIVYAGHSQGSLIGKGFMDQYPKDVDVVMLTGWSTLAPSGNLVFPGLAVASSIHERFAGLEPGYLTDVNASDRAPFYSVPGKDYDPAILPYDWAREDVYAIGTAFTGANQTLLSNFTGPVFVLTGQEDRIFCGPSGNCGAGNASILPGESKYFPKASSFGYYSPANTGHDWNYHYTQKQSFAAAFEYLAKVGY